jgi:lysylphosphatidylglycerol synthetase-like protein (DUF2156 family)
LKSSPPVPSDPLRPIARLQTVRRRFTVGTALVGLADLAGAVLPPSHRHLTFLLRFVPLVVAQGAAVLLALDGLVLLALAWGLRRGQRQAWALSCLGLAFATVLHLARGVDAVQAALSLGLLAALLAFRRDFSAPVDRRTSVSVAVAAVGGLAATITLVTASVEAFLAIDRDGSGSLPLHVALVGVAEGLVGVRSAAFSMRMERFLSPTLLGVGLTLAVVAVLAVSRPLADRRRFPNERSHAIARRLVSEHGGGTLDYFALRHDKWHYITGKTLVTYAVLNGVCLVSPDPIGPEAERDHAWAAFCRFAASNGWTVAVLAAASPWLCTYRKGGMHAFYVGDEAIVNVAAFDLAGNHKKGLRQAVQRVRRYGYEVSFHDPRQLDPALAASVRQLMGSSRRGHCERGFSMTLGRLLDPDDDRLLLAVAHAPDGSPVAFCQFVPAPSIGGYSLDVMRRDRGAHPNGLIDFLLVSTIEHIRANGFDALSMNFAALRAFVSGDRNHTRLARLFGWVLRRLSRTMQVESLWRFNAKFDPTWAARYVAVASVMHIPAVTLAIGRAESLWEIPVLGRYLARSQRVAEARRLEAA